MSTAPSTHHQRHEKAPLFFLNCGVRCSLNMTIVPLTTYLKTYRKRTGLTHEEMAFLLGSMSGTSVSRHENAQRLPILRTALMYEVILDATVSELYEGLFAEMQEAVCARARGLCASLERQKRTLTVQKKIALLQAIIGKEVAQEGK